MKNYESVGPASVEPENPGGELDDEQRAILEMQAAFCRVMGHPVRLFLLHYINGNGGEIGSSELAARAGISRATLSQHLGRMTAVGLVRTRREGKFVYVRLAREEIGQACELVHSALLCELRERASLVPDGER